MNFLYLSFFFYVLSLPPHPSFLWEGGRRRKKWAQADGHLGHETGAGFFGIDRVGSNGPIIADGFRDQYWTRGNLDLEKYSKTNSF